MLFDSLKTKSIVKKMEEFIKKRYYVPSLGAPKTVGILQKDSELFDKESIDQLRAVFGKHLEIEVLTYVSVLKKEDKESEVLFSNKQIGWNGVFKGEALKRFSQKRFDILISYYSEHNLMLEYVTASSEATFKVGVLENGDAINDLTILSTKGKKRVFVKELQKYLKILKIID